MLAGLGVLFLGVASSSFLGSHGFGFDFYCYYAAAERLVRGEGLYLPQNVSGPFAHGAPAVYVYAPPLAVFLVPLASLPFQAAAVVWLLVRLALLGAACALMPVARWIRLAVFGVAAFSAPLLVDLNLGNVSLIVTFLAVVTWRWHGTPVGSVALAAALALRPALGVVLLAWLGRRAIRPVAWTLVAGLALVAVTLPFVGAAGYLDFARVLRNVQVAGVPHNGSLESAALLLGFPARVATVALFAGYAVSVAAMLAALRRDPELGYVVSLSASLLLTPLLWGHYLVLLLVPAAFLAQRGRAWAVALPLLGWLPEVAFSVAALVGLLAPFLAGPPEAAPSRDPESRPRASVPAPAVG